MVIPCEEVSHQHSAVACTALSSVTTAQKWSLNDGSIELPVISQTCAACLSRPIITVIKCVQVVNDGVTEDLFKETLI
jgi:hypothetical protein